MKKLAVLFLALTLGLASVMANPVDVEKAKLVGKNFVASTFSSHRQDADLQLVYTGMSARGEACFYVFNVGDSGFVILSADDRFRPITGYSDEGAFATENRSPELDFYLAKIIEARTSANVVLYDDAVDEWQSLLDGNGPFSRNGGKGAYYLCETKWNQNSPYNLYAPEAGSGPGGRCYAGCVATAMSQVMRYWSQPIQGSGSHSYYSNYGSLSANFGATTYNWEHMPFHINTASPTEDIEAVALLMYHCGVAVNMGFSPSGSGAYSEDVPGAIQSYFGYASQAQLRYRNSYSLHDWKDLLKGQFDLGWPVYYSGYSDSGGHAFVCDGYDDNDLFHFNWGWGGSSDGWFVVDEIDYSNWAGTIVNYVPAQVYQYMPECPANFTVESLGDTQFSAQLSWTNPVATIHGQALSSIEEVVVCRDGKPIHTFTEVSPGQSMSYTDHYLPTTVTYSVYAVSNMAKSVSAKIDQIVLGPTCPWTVMMSSSNPEGWMNGAIVVTDGKGVEVATISLTSEEQTKVVQMPMGQVSFSWKVPLSAIEQIHFEIQNGNHTVMTSFDGSSTDLKSGLFYRSVNSCQTGEKLKAPFNLRASLRDDDVELHWDMDAAEDCSFFIYRDGILYDITDAMSYLDESKDNIFHHYYITAYNGQVESDPSNYCNVQPETECLAPTGLRVEFLSGGKFKMMWDAPQASGLSGYWIYRRVEGGEFTRIKASSNPFYEGNVSSFPNEVYEYAVKAYYSQSHSESAYASTKADPSLNFVQVNQTIIPMRLDTDLNEDGVKLVWLDALVADSYSVYRNGTLLADDVVGASYLDTAVTEGDDYCYIVIGHNTWHTSNPSNEACVDWATMGVEESSQPVSLYPNPAHDQITVSGAGLTRLVVLNLLGQVVMSKDVDDDMAVIDLSALKSGVYLVQAACDSGIGTLRFVKL